MDRGTNILKEVSMFVLRFYIPVNPMGSCQARSIYLTRLLLGRLSQLPFLNQRKGENDCRKYFTIYLHERMLLTRREMNQQPLDHQSNVHPTEVSIILKHTSILSSLRTDGHSNEWILKLLFRVILIFIWLFYSPTSWFLGVHNKSHLNTLKLSVK